MKRSAYDKRSAEKCAGRGTVHFYFLKINVGSGQNSA